MKPVPTKEFPTRPIWEDCFVVLAREMKKGGAAAERKLAAVSSYEEAERIRRECETQERNCVIRFVGPAGGGD